MPSRSSERIDNACAWAATAGSAILFSHRIFRQRLDALVDLARSQDPEFEDKVWRVVEAFDAYFSTRDRLLADAVNRSIFSFEYAQNRPLNQPSQSNFRIILASQPKNGKAMLTANFGFTIYDRLPAGVRVGRLRDVQAAAQLDRPVGQIAHFGEAVFSLSGYYQYMKVNALLTIGPGNLTPVGSIQLPGEAAVLLAPKGNIGIAQAKLTIPVKNSGVRMPIAITWVNRTELIKAKEVRGHIGLTLDVDTLFLGNR